LPTQQGLLRRKACLMRHRRWLFFCGVIQYLGGVLMLLAFLSSRLQNDLMFVGKWQQIDSFSLLTSFRTTERNYNQAFQKDQVAWA
jgi:hypothetical protein